MEIRDPIHGSIELSKSEVTIIDSVPYQRLRQIKQLGFSELSFPGATHNRYLHSIGVTHLSGLIFDSIFKKYQFSKAEVKSRFRQVVRLGALLHDIGHGPLSHTTEEVMPPVKDLHIKAYEKRRSDISLFDDSGRKANHEDYTIKFITDSPLTEIIKNHHDDIDPIHIACLIDKTLDCPDDFFKDQGVDFRSLLSQIVSSEMDADRMDYLERDAFFCGTNYGKVELEWLIANLTYHRVEDQMYLALNRRALYTFDDFLLARHHMHLMVYFHHKSIIYEEFLLRYLTSKDCQFFLPANINDYIAYTDYALYEHLAKSNNKWAQMIATRRPYKVLFEKHSTAADNRPQLIQQSLEDEGIKVIFASSTARLSKYHSSHPTEKSFPIYVVDQYDRWSKPYPIEETTEIFQKYEEIRRIDRLYVSPEQFAFAESILKQKPV
jgi:hypothetical protein